MWLLCIFAEKGCELENTLAAFGRDRGEILGNHSGRQSKGVSIFGRNALAYVPFSD
jgi:hypothetical protein